MKPPSAKIIALLMIAYGFSLIALQCNYGYDHDMYITPGRVASILRSEPLTLKDLFYRLEGYSNVSAWGHQGRPLQLSLDTDWSQDAEAIGLSHDMTPASSVDSADTLSAFIAVSDFRLSAIDPFGSGGRKSWAEFRVEFDSKLQVTGWTREPKRSDHE